MMIAKEVKDWINLVPDDSAIAVDEGGLCLITSNGDWCEIGGIPFNQERIEKTRPRAVSTLTERIEIMTTKHEHTPGPWTAVANHISAEITTIDGTVYPTIALVSTTTTAAAPNARLIAAAPELLDTLHDLTALYASTKGADPHFIAKARATITKAKGEQS